MDRKIKRDYRKHKKSRKWRIMYQKFSEKCEKAKSDYSENIVSDLKTSNPSQWY
jgi:hypothetical protein